MVAKPSICLQCGTLNVSKKVWYWFLLEFNTSNPCKWFQSDSQHCILVVRVARISFVSYASHCVVENITTHARTRAPLTVNGREGRIKHTWLYAGAILPTLCWQSYLHSAWFWFCYVYIHICNLDIYENYVNHGSWRIIVFVVLVLEA